jgi:hypothetical protein
MLIRLGAIGPHELTPLSTVDRSAKLSPMKPLADPVHAPLSTSELDALDAHAHAEVAPVDLELKLLRAFADQALLRRGFLQWTGSASQKGRALVVTPEGLAALLDCRGVTTALSRAERTSAGHS